VPAVALHHRGSQPHPDALTSGRYYGNTLGHHVKIKMASPPPPPPPQQQQQQQQQQRQQQQQLEQQQSSSPQATGGRQQQQPVHKPQPLARRGSSTLQSVFKASLESVQINPVFSTTMTTQQQQQRQQQQQQQQQQQVQ
jgi:hypothetical protein